MREGTSGRDAGADAHGARAGRSAPGALGAEAGRHARARERLGVGLTEIRALVEQVVAGEYGGTLAETELLARQPRAAGVDAVAVRETPL
ncbi:hypothetical protein [Streptomyces sp. PTD9-10]|uniref:hypothetical protein n=1 Tax=Streptomyces sp. PTD9-10 TaxID=3120151 RepID=UPI0030080929